MSRIGITSASLFLMAAFYSGRAIAAQVPVISEPIEAHTCNVAEVRGLGSNSRLFIRSGPGRNYSRLGSLPEHARVYVCNVSRRWLGIVFSRTVASCAYTGRWARSLPEGCRSGWVDPRWVEILSG
jgi:hypothetical protein